MSRKSAKNRSSIKSQDRRNQAGWYRPLIYTIAAVAILFFSYTVLKPAIFGVPVRIEPALTGVFISHDRVITMPAEDIMIPYSSITSIEALPSRPELKKVNGLDSVKTLIGKFTSDTLGDVQVYATDYRNPATVFLKVVAKTGTYLITPADPAGFAGVVQSRINK